MNSTDLTTLIVGKIDRLKRKGYTVEQTFKKKDLHSGFVVLNIDGIRLLRDVDNGQSFYKILVNMENITVDIQQKDIEHIYSIMSEGLVPVQFEETPDLLTYLKN